jgi:serpin B
MKYFQSDIEAMDFAKEEEAIKAINDYISMKTHGMIENMLQSGDVSDKTSAVLVNCIYFKGLWLTPFNKNLTKSGEFQLADGTTKTVDFMFAKGEFKLAFLDEFVDAAIIELPYVNSTLTFTIVLPRQADGLGKVAETARTFDWTKLSSKLRKMKSEVTLPKFNATFKQYMNPALINVRP